MKKKFTKGSSGLGSVNKELIDKRTNFKIYL